MNYSWLFSKQATRYLYLHARTLVTKPRHAHPTNHIVKQTKTAIPRVVPRKLTVQRYHPRSQVQNWSVRERIAAATPTQTNPATPGITFVLITLLRRPVPVKQVSWALDLKGSLLSNAGYLLTLLITQENVWTLQETLYTVPSTHQSALLTETATPTAAGWEKVPLTSPLA